MSLLGTLCVDVDVCVGVILCVIMTLPFHVEVIVRRLSHENLDVYQRAIEFLALAVGLIEALPKGNATLADQLRRASLSSVLNIAEGAGKPTPGEARRHFGIARGSALECGAALDVMRLLRLGEPNTIDRGKDLLVSVVAMLSKMCRITTSVLSPDTEASSRSEACRGNAAPASRNASLCVDTP